METKTIQNGTAGRRGRPASTQVKPQSANQSEQTQENQNEALTDRETPFTPEPQATSLTVEDKIRKVNSLNDLIGKRSILKSHLERVEALRFGDYDEKDTIAITSANGQTYTIRSTSLCQKISVLLKEEISAKVVEVEAEINF